MRNYRLAFLSLGLAVGLLGCGQSPDATRGPRPPASADTGILENLTEYKPAAAVGSPGGGRAGGAADGAAKGGDAAAQVQNVVETFIALLKDGEIGRALKYFNPEHVRALDAEKVDVLFATFEKMDRLTRGLEEKLGRGPSAQALAGLRGGLDLVPKWDVLDNDHATVTPNPALALFGPVKMSPTITLARVGGEWRFELSSPLTAEDADAIVAFHRQFQEMLDRVTDLIESQEKIEPAQLLEILSKAATGQPVELGAPGTPAKDGAGGKLDERAGGLGVAPPDAAPSVAPPR